MTGNTVTPGSSGASKDAGAPGNAAIPGGNRGWYSRGYLPHLDQPGLYQSINFRLYDSVPESVFQQWKEQLRWQVDLPSDAPAAVALRQRIVKYEDAGHGHCWLKDEQIATLVENVLLRFDGERYRLMAWCVMPNHVHVLIETIPGVRLGEILHSWKSFTAQKANELLGRKGTFWARDYYDRYIRDDRHFADTVVYIEQNPVKAGLVERAEAWRYSSAARRG
jgi:REP element-mobilizing transposase RayT